MPFATFRTAWARGCGTAVDIPGQPEGEDQADEGYGFRAQHVPGTGDGVNDTGQIVLHVCAV